MASTASYDREDDLALDVTPCRALVRCPGSREWERAVDHDADGVVLKQEFHSSAPRSPSSASFLPDATAMTRAPFHLASRSGAG